MLQVRHVWEDKEPDTIGPQKLISGQNKFLCKYRNNLFNIINIEKKLHFSKRLHTNIDLLIGVYYIRYFFFSHQIFYFIF